MIIRVQAINLGEAVSLETVEKNHVKLTYANGSVCGDGGRYSGVIDVICEKGQFVSLQNMWRLC